MRLIRGAEVVLLVSYDTLAVDGSVGVKKAVQAPPTLSVQALSAPASSDARAPA